MLKKSCSIAKIIVQVHVESISSSCNNCSNEKCDKHPLQGVLCEAMVRQVGMAAQNVALYTTATMAHSDTDTFPKHCLAFLGP